MSNTALATRTADLTDQGDQTFAFRIQQWLDALDANYAAKGYTHAVYTHECVAPRKGQKFVKVVTLINGKVNSVHAFYDIRTGEVYKAATFAAPAKHVRFSLLDDASFTDLIATCDWSGVYLYMKG